MLKPDYNADSAKYNHDLALELAGAGWHVFPCKPDKTPYTTHGLRDATTDPATVGEWWKRWPGALVGVSCAASGVFAVDVDTHEGQPNGWTEWLTRCADGDRPDGPTQRTPAGGAHFLYKMPPGASLPGKAAPGIDIRANGYICTGKLPDGRQYERHGWALPVPDAPDWLLDWITTQRPAAQPATGRPDAGLYWLNKALAAGVPGCRNETGFWLACQLRDAGLTQAQAAPIMADYAARVPGDGYTEREAAASLAQAYKAPAREPAGVQVVLPEQPAAAGLVWHTAAEALRPRPPVDWLLDGRLRAGSVVVVAGDPGGGKTWLLLNLALCVATGAPWLGVKTKRAPVLWVDAESGMARMCDRVQAAMTGLHAPESAPFRFVTPSDRLFDLRKSADQDTLTAGVSETGAGLVIVDALVDVMPGGDENAVQDVGPLMLALRRLADVTGAAVVLIHHNNKAGGYRGSTAIAGAVDALLSLTTTTSADGHRDVVLKAEKARDTEPWTISARLNWSEGAFWTAPLVADDRPQPQKLSPSQSAVINLLAGGNATMETIKAGCSKPAAAARAVYDLINAGKVRRVDGGGAGVAGVFALVGATSETSEKPLKTSEISEVNACNLLNL